MLDTNVGIAVTLSALGLFAVVGVVGAARFGLRDRDRYLSARGSQGGLSLALSFFASALGTWILISPPEVGTFAGLLGVVGYAVGQAAAIAAFALLGPAVLRRLPSGSTILEFVRARFGRPTQLYVGAISIAYMFVFLASELTAVGLVVSLIVRVDPVVPVVAVAAVTTAYTAYGGLPASLATDRWQAWVILALVGAAAVATVTEIPDPGTAAAAGGLGTVTRTGGETFVVLAVAIVAANLLHQGFWQRVWAARDRRSLVRGSVGGAVLILPVVLVTGAAGAVAAGAGRVEVPSLAFFGLLAGLPELALALVVALGVALVASTTDTLQNGLTSIVARDVAGGRLSVPAARAVTVGLTIPAAVIALQGYSVLRLFLIADLLAATVVVPVFLGLWARPPRAAALVGAMAGLASVVVLGWAQEGAVWQGVLLLTLPEGPALGPFVVAPTASGAVALAMSVAGPARPGVSR